MMLSDSGGSCIFAFVLYFRASQTPKNIFKKIIFSEMISSKIFYDGNHFMSKQIEY